MGHYRELMDEWFDRVWGQNDLAFIDQVTNIDVTTKGHMGHKLKGPEDFKAFHTLITAMLDTISIKIIQSVEDDEWASFLYKVSALKKGTQEPIEVTGSSMIRFQDNKITEVHEHFDFMRFFEIIGRLPEQCLNTLLLDSTASFS